MPSIYQPRRPRASPLWQLVHHGWEEFLANYESKHRKDLGPLHPAAVATVQSFLRCGDLASGFTRTFYAFFLNQIWLILFLIEFIINKLHYTFQSNAIIYRFIKMKSNHKSTLIFVLIVVVIDTAGFGLIFPVLPQLLNNLLHSDISTAAKYGGWLSFAYAIMQFVFAPVLGNLSDQYGRRPVLLSSLFGFSIDCIFLAFAPSILWLFVGRTIAGITGASYSVASACVADISTDDNRTKNFGLINAGFGLGFIIGPIIGGTLGQFGTHTPFIVAAILSFINFIFGYYFFPESLKANNRRKFDRKRANPFGSLKHLQKFPLIKTLVLSMIFVSIANHSMESVWAFFTIEKFKWSTSLVGYSLAFIGILSIIVQLWLVSILAKKLGDKRMAVLGFVLMMTGFFLFAFTPWQWLLFTALLLFIVGGIQGTAVQSIMSSAMPDNEQGELQGALGSLMGLTTLIAPPLMTSSFSYFTGKQSEIYFPGIPFLIASILTLISLILFLKSFKKSNRLIKSVDK